MGRVWHGCLLRVCQVRDLDQHRRVMAAAVVAATAFLGACTGFSQAQPPHESAASTSTTPDGSLLLDVAAVADSYPQMTDGDPRDPRSIESVEWLAYCGEAFGFDVTIVTGPGQPPLAWTNAPNDQMGRSAEVQDACKAEAVSRGWIMPVPSTPEQLRVEYRRLSNVNECLAGLGYGTSPPSLEEFLEAGEWNVYANTPKGGTLVIAPSAAGTDLPAMDALQLQIQAACPLWPSY